MNLSPFSWRPALVAAAISAAALTAQASEVSLRLGEPDGWFSPNLIGYNMATNPPGSNVESFLRQSGVGAIRLRLQARRADDEELPDESVQTQEQFVAAVKTFRQSRHDDLRKIWTLPAEHNRASLEELRRDGVDILACVTYSPNKFQLLTTEGAVDWRMAWDYWRRYYAAASELAGLGVARFQIFNEPDHKESIKMTMDEYLCRMAFGTDAVQAALADEPGRGGPTVQPLISAPVTANIAAFGPRSGRPDTRDLERGWGEQTLLNLHRKWNGDMDPAWSQFQQYGFQYYSMDAQEYAKKIADLRDGIRRVLDGKMMPIIASETNVRIAAKYAELPETQDSPTDFAALGQISAVMAGGPINEIYFFRMTQSANLGKGEIKKNGTHYASNEDPFHNIGGTAKTAEIIRLLAGSFAGRKPLRKVDGGKDAGLCAVATDDALWIASSSTEAMHTVNLDYAAWKPKDGDVLLVDEVSTRRHGDITAVLEANASGRVKMEIPGYSVSRVRLLRGAGAAHRIPAATSFGMKAGAKPAADKSLSVGHHVSPEPATKLVYMGFPAPAGGATTLLEVATENPNDQPVILHLYAFADTPWTAAGDKHPHLAPGVQPNNQIEPRLIADVGSGVEYAGVLTAPPGKSTARADLTPALARLKGHPFSLLVVREPRFDGDAGEAHDITLTAPPALEIYHGAPAP